MIDLAERFKQPEGWQWHAQRRNGRLVRMGSVMPPEGKADGVVVCLPGLSEFSEKYFEIARDNLNRNLGSWVIDWHGQGGAGRYFRDSKKRHSDGFAEDVADLHSVITDFAKASGLPLFLLAHSMGANIGMRYLQTHPGIFNCAALSAPMWGLKVFEKTPDAAALAVTFAASLLLNDSYPKGQSDQDAVRTAERSLSLSTDPVRSQVHNTWCEAFPELQSGGITYGWLYEAVLSGVLLSRRSALAKINIPTVIGLAGKDDLVDNAKIRKISGILKNAQLMEFPEAGHELFMERDEIRGPFLENFYKLVQQTRHSPAGLETKARKGQYPDYRLGRDHP